MMISSGAQPFWRLKRLVTPLNNRHYINNFIYLSIYLTLTADHEGKMYRGVGWSRDLM